MYNEDELKLTAWFTKCGGGKEGGAKVMKPIKQNKTHTNFLSTTKKNPVFPKKKEC